MNANSKYSKQYLDSLINRAISNDAKAQQELAFWYEEGLSDPNGVSILTLDMEQSTIWYKKAAKNGDLNAITRLGDFYSEGIGCNQNMQKAIEYYDKAIKKGYSPAANNLATIYRDLKDYEKAFIYYEKAQQLLSAECGKTVKTLNVALCYLYGLGIDKDVSKAIDIFEFISNNHNEGNFDYEVNEANFLLGQIYLSGKHVVKDIDIARKYLLLADIDKDHLLAQELLIIIGRN